jgi:twitching motility protein PilT
LGQAFSLEQRDAVFGRIADSLVGVLSQRLVPKVSGGRTGLYELMIATPAIRSAIRQGDIPQIENTITTSSASGMISIRRQATDLIAKGLITESAVAHIFRND